MLMQAGNCHHPCQHVFELYGQIKGYPTLKIVHKGEEYKVRQHDRSTTHTHLKLLIYPHDDLTHTALLLLLLMIAMTGHRLLSAQ